MQIETIPRQELAEKLYQALKEKRTIEPLTQRYPDLPIDEAYRISQAFLDRRMSNDNESIVGKKIGVTSDAVQKMLGVFQPDFGFLTNSMQVANATTVCISNNLIQPKAEAEIAFRLKRTLKGPGVTPQDVLAATESIMPCFEIVDSRIEDWRIKIQDTVADNASCGIFILGEKEFDPQGLDLAALTVEVFKNDEKISTGKGAAVQGNPLAAVAWLANTLGSLGTPLLAGEIILSGSLVPLEPVVAGDKFTMKLVQLGGTAAVSFS